MKKDRFFNALLTIVGIGFILLTAAIVYTLASMSGPAVSHFGFFDFLSGSGWSDKTESYGAWPFIVGTLETSLLALLLCVPFSLAVALFSGEYFRGKKIAAVVSAVVDMLAGIPSIVYGLWGFYTIRHLMIVWGWSDQGFGVILASIVLAIMIIPYASSLSTEFISMVPGELKEAAYGLGATRFEVIKSVSLPGAASGIFAAYTLAFGRALGETMAVTMLIGNTNNIPFTLSESGDLIETGNTMASVIANQFGEATGLKLSALFAIGLILFLITALINCAAKIIISRLKP